MDQTMPVKEATRLCLAVLCLSLLTQVVESRTATGQLTAGPGGFTGKEFIFGVLDYMGEITRQGWQVQIDVGAKDGGHFNVYYPASKINRSYYINPSGAVKVYLDARVRDGTYIDSNAIRISSNTDLSVLVTASHYSSASSYVIYPTYVANNSYYAASYTPALGTKYASRVMVVAIQNNTEVTLNIDGNITTAELDRMDVFQYDSPGFKDLTGCKIYSNELFVVLSGSSASQLAGKTSAVSPIAAQMLQNPSYRFIVPSFENSKSLFVRVLTDQAQPYNITIINSTTLRTYTTKGLQTYMLGTEPTSVLTSTDISLVLYNSPFMSIIPGINKYLKEYSFVVPTLTGFPNTHKLVAIVPSGAASGLLLDGAVFTGTAQHIMSVDDEYTMLTGNVTKGFHHIVNVDPNIAFGLLIYDDYTGFFVGMTAW